MAQARSKLRNAHNRRYFVGGSDSRSIIGDDQGAPPGLWRDKHREVEQDDQQGNLLVPLPAATADLNRHWYEAITGKMPIGLYAVAVCYATAVIVLGWMPWNVLLILLLFGRNKRLRIRAFETMPAHEPVLSCRHGSSL